MDRKFVQIIETVLVGLSAIALFLYIYVAVSRANYPFTIEWVESNTFLHIVRVLEGKPIYTPPNFDFIPMIYPPFYYYIVAIIASLTGQIMFSMRLVSIVASFLLFSMIFIICRLRKHTPQSSFMAVGMFAASYAMSGFWFDLGRVDTLAVALLLSGYVLIVAETKREIISGVFGSLILFLACATKQSLLPAMPFFLFALILRKRWEKALWAGLSFSVIMGLYFLVMNFVSKGWFWIYLFTIPSALPVSLRIAVLDFWTVYFIPNLPWIVLAIISAGGLLWILRAKEKLYSYAAFGFTFFLPLLGISVLTLAKQWSYLNALMPALAAISVLGSEAYFHAKSSMIVNNRHTWKVKGFYYLISISLVLQFVSLRYDFRSQIPTENTLDAGHKISGEN